MFGYPLESQKHLILGAGLLRFGRGAHSVTSPVCAELTMALSTWLISLRFPPLDLPMAGARLIQSLYSHIPRIFVARHPFKRPYSPHSTRFTSFFFRLPPMGIINPRSEFFLPLPPSLFQCSPFLRASALYKTAFPHDRVPVFL